MRRFLIYVYKTFWMIMFLSKNAFYTCSLRFRLYLNNARCLGGLKSQGGGSVVLRINKNAQCVVIGRNVIFNNYNDAGWNSRCSIWVRGGATLVIGDNSGFNGALIYAADSVTIGKNVKVGGGSRIFDTDFHPLDYAARRSTIEGTKTAPVFIEDDVFIGTSCIIGKGVHIGARSIVAAGSVVVKDIPADEIWGGNPAHFIRKICQE